MAEKPARPTAENVRAHWAGITAAAHDAIAGKIDARKMAQLTEVLERHEADLAPIVAPFVAHLLDDPATPEPVRALLAEMTDPTHFTTALLIGIGVGGLVGPLLGSIVAPLVQDIANQTWAKNPSMPLSPAELALGMLRHNPSLGDPYAEAAKSGLSGGRLDALAYNTGDSLPMGELLLLWRRGDIGDGRLLEGLRQSRMRDEWLPEVKMLQFAPPGAGTVITGVLKGWLTLPEGAKKLKEAGIDPTNFDWLRHSAGRPPGLMSMLGLLNRGYIGEDLVRKSILQSDINPDYTEAALQLKWYHVPPRSVVPMLRSGSITEAQARQLLKEHGVRPADQDAFVLEATQHSSAAVKELSASQIAKAYEEKLIPRATALTRLQTLKYNAADSTLLLDMADAAVAARTLAAATTRVHALYVTRRITRAEASADLSRIGQPAAAVTQLLTLWDEELVTETPHLTIAHWQGALHRTVITLTEFIAQCHLAGWSGLAVKVLAAGAYPPGKVPANVLALNPGNL